MDNFITFAVTFFVSYLVIQLVIGLWTARKNARIEMQNALYKKLDEIIHRVKVEEHYGHLYWFDEDNDRFLAQGETQEELVSVLKERFPQHIFFLNKGDKVIAASTNWEPSDQKKLSINNLALD